MDREMIDVWCEVMNDVWCEEGCYKGLVVVDDVLLLVDLRESVNVKKYDLSEVDWLEIEGKYLSDGGDEVYGGIENWMGWIKCLKMCEY